MADDWWWRRWQRWWWRWQARFSLPASNGAGDGDGGDGGGGGDGNGTFHYRLATRIRLKRPMMASNSTTCLPRP
eukprot:5162061-Lingulodinium_polyedra.AAC.1